MLRVSIPRTFRVEFSTFRVDSNASRARDPVPVPVPIRKNGGAAATSYRLITGEASLLRLLTAPQEDEQMPEPSVPPAFVELFRDLVRAYQPRTIDRETVRVYWETLQTFPIETLKASAVRLRQRSTSFFPTTGEWFQAATRVRTMEAQQATGSCERCHDRGVVRIAYRSGEPHDIGICSCAAGRAFSAPWGEALVRARLGLSDEHRVAYLEDFEEDAVA